MHTAGILAAIVVTLNGSPVKDAEICGFKTPSADTPFHQLLASRDVVCNGQFPPGLWNVFARRGSELITARTVLIDSRQQMPEIELRLEPAATLSFTNRDGFAYVTDTTSAFPSDANGNALVPADRDLVPLLAREGNLIAVGEPLRLDARARKSVTLDSSSRAIATWLSIAPGDLEALRSVRRKQPPQIKGVINPIRGTVVMNRAMQFIRDVKPGKATIELGGVPWKRQTASVEVPETGVAVTGSPLMLVPTSSVNVKWFTWRPLDELSKSGAVGAALHILSCRTTRNLEILDRDTCKLLGRREWSKDAQSGEATFDDLDAGAYVVEFTFGDLPPIREAIRLEKFEQETLPLDIDYTTVFGRITVGGRRLPSRVAITFGFTHTVDSDDDGEYIAVLAKPLAANRVISVRSRDGSVDGEVIVDRDVLPNSRFDIDLPANRITVEATDAKTGAPIADALVRYGAFRSDEMSSVYYFRLAYDPETNTLTRTRDDGRYIIRNLPAGKTLRICLEHESYERTCADPRKLTSTEEQTVRIAMEPRDRFSGRIAGVSDVAGGQIYWFANNGVELEHTSVKADGTFRFNLRHEPGEAVVFVSVNHPLFAFAQPQLTEDGMVVTRPAAPSRTFAITIGSDSAQQDAIATIAIGNLVVPYPAFAQHLALHGSQLDLRNKGPLVVPDILETAPISAILGPPLSEVTQAMRRVDLFRLPQYRGLPRKLVGGEKVVFAMRTIS